mgnify:CR=1 FL=1
MSTLTGTANFAQERVPEKYVPYYTIAVGTTNIIAGIITTIQQFLITKPSSPNILNVIPKKAH